MACIVKANPHGNLAFRLYWNGIESWEGTGLKDTPKNRQRMEARAVLISEEIDKNTFDYLKWFPNGNKAYLFKPKPTTPQTIGDYYRVWIERKKPPVVRKGLERDYRDHFRLYVLPKFEDTKVAELTPALLEAFRSYLLREYEARTPTGRLSLKSVKNIMDGSFRAMIRDARTVDYLIEKDPFEVLIWPRKLPSKPDPFEEEERDAIIQYFRQKNHYYYPFVYTLFFTGMRPSEALGLCWSDVDLRRGEVSILKSRYLGEESGTKTEGSERVIRLHPNVTELLKAVKPLHVAEDTPVFLNHESEPINFHTWRAKIWYRALRATGLRVRKPYTMRHTFISVGLTNSVNIKWLADYCGTSVAMIEKHYGRYIRNDADEQLSRLMGPKTETLGETVEEKTGRQETQAAEKIREKNGGPTWIRTRDQPVMSRWL
jgi:integrase